MPVPPINRVGAGTPYRISPMNSLRRRTMDPALREEILSVLKAATDMTIATIRPDGYPQATTVSYVSHGLTMYFGCAAESQKAQNIAHNDKVSLTVTLPYFNWEEIRGLF